MLVPDADIVSRAVGLSLGERMILVVVSDPPSLGYVALCSLVESTRERQLAIVRRGGMGR